MRIGIDVRYLSHGILGGVQRYTANLVPALMANGTEHEFVLYADTKREFELKQLPPHARLKLLPYSSPLSSAINDWTMGRVLAQDRLDLMHYPANYGFVPPPIHNIITLHDEINILPWREIIRGHPKKLSVMAKMTYLHLCSLRSLKQVDAVITVSNYSREKILKNSHLPAAKVHAVLSGLAPDFRPVTDAATLAAVKQRHGLEKPFILGDVLKNSDKTVAAWGHLPESLRQSMQMVFFCRNPQPPEHIQAAIASGQAKVLIRPSSDDLRALYSSARAFVFPSWIEGFGLPVLEAMACGAPVVSSDRGSIPEVAGEAALMCDVDDIAGLARLIERVLTDEAEAERLRKAGYERIKLFSWDRAAKEVLRIYEAVGTKQG